MYSLLLCVYFSSSLLHIGSQRIGTKSPIEGGACIIKCDSAWLDDLVGGKKNLGYAFLSEALCSNQKLELRNAKGRRVDISRSMGEILTRIVVQKMEGVSLTYPLELLIGTCEARQIRLSSLSRLPDLNSARCYPNTSYGGGRSNDGTEEFLKYMELHSRALYVDIFSLDTASTCHTHIYYTHIQDTMPRIPS